MNADRSILIVDELKETQEVLRAALERPGMRVLSASKAEEGELMARAHRPDLIVVDLEMDRVDAGRLSAEMAAPRIGECGRLLVLGTCRRHAPSQGEFVAKPYHYAALIEKIEELLTVMEEPAAPPRTV